MGYPTFRQTFSCSHENNSYCWTFIVPSAGTSIGQSPSIGLDIWPILTNPLAWYFFGNYRLGFRDLLKTGDLSLFASSKFWSFGYARLFPYYILLYHIISRFIILYNIINILIFNRYVIYVMACVCWIYGRVTRVRLLARFDWSHLLYPSAPSGWKGLADGAWHVTK